MANAIPIRVPGTGGSTLEYTLPANMMQFVQSVNAVIDNTAGGDTKPVLTVLDSSNEVIADVPQGRVLDGGAQGRATWALRLADELAAIEEVVSPDHSITVIDPFGPVVGVKVADPALQQFTSPDGSLTVTNPNGPNVTAILNRFTVKASMFDPGGGIGGATQQGLVTPGVPLHQYTMNLSCPMYLSVNSQVEVFLEQYSGVTLNASASLSALLIGRPVTAAPGTINTTIGAQVRTAPVFTSVPSGAGGALAVFKTIDFDTNAMANLVTHPTTLKANTAGVYLCTASVTFVTP